MCCWRRCPGGGGSLPSTSRSRARARESRGRTTAVVSPSTSAISRDSSPSQRCSSSTSWSRALSRRIAAVTSARCTTSSLVSGTWRASSRRSRSPRALRRRSPRRWFASTRRATPYSHGRRSGAVRRVRQPPPRDEERVGGDVARVLGPVDPAQREAEHRVEVVGVEVAEGPLTLVEGEGHVTHMSGRAADRCSPAARGSRRARTPPPRGAARSPRPPGARPPGSGRPRRR